ncbi:hypothetical protein ERH_1306 [Erysipelothrix rhusiopathiae str. Fujisawa]|nr:hypothetical protein ERH_1306 [Erysipelothrix rhusiopathiae str. Fujisawa]
MIFFMKNVYNQSHFTQTVIFNPASLYRHDHKKNMDLKIHVFLFN